MDNNNNKDFDNAFIGAFIFMLILAMIVPYFSYDLFFKSSDNYVVNENNQEVHVIDTIELDTTLKLYSMKDAYTVDGEKYYIVRFREDITDTEIECHIDGKHSDKLDKAATYDAKAEIIYCLNDYNRLASEDEKLTYENKQISGEINNDTLRTVAHLGPTTKEKVGNIFGAHMIGVTFMFDEYMQTELDEENYVSEHIKKYPDAEITIIEHEAIKELS